MANATMSWPPCSRIRPHVEFLLPVWFFSDDLEEFLGLLRSLGRATVVASKTFQIDIPAMDEQDEELNPSGAVSGDIIVNYEKFLPLESTQQALEHLPIQRIYAEIPARGISILILPTMVELRRLCDWRPGTEEFDAIPQLHDFLRRKRHWLFLLGQRGWQLYTALVSIMLMLLGLTIKTWVNNLATVLGACLGGVVIVWAVSGIFLPNHSHLTLWRISRKDFFAYIFLGVVVVLVLFVTALISAEISCLLCRR